MDPKQLVQVFTHTGGGRGKIATGYPVAPGRVLTARHALHGDGATGEIEVRWYNLEGDARRWRPASVCWEGADGVDAALLACEFPAGAAAAPYLISCSMPSHLYDWISTGFAAVGSRDDVTPPVPLRGRILPLADGLASGTFELGVDYAASAATDWQGASGGPVFVGHRILGVVASSQRLFQGRRATATATCRLLEAPEFRAALNYEEKWAALRTYQGDIFNALLPFPLATRCLADELKMDSREALRGPDAFCHAVVDKLLLERLDELLPRLSVAHGKLFERAPDDADAVWRTACLVMPAVCDIADPHVGHWLESGHGLLRLPAATETLAEIIMAAAEARDVRFGSDEDRAEPLLRIPVPAFGGEAAGLAQFEREWHEYAIKKFVPDKEARSRATFDTLIGLAAEELQDRAEYRKERYYYVVTVARADQAAAWNAVVARLRACYRSVVFVTLVGSDPDLFRERRLRFHIVEMLRKKKH
jgi:hypothetical protein